MGAPLSRLNNKLSFDCHEYLRERSELSRLLRAVASDSAARRAKRGAVQTIAGATSVAASLAGAVVVAPATLGLSLLPAVAISAAVVGNSLAAASVTACAASFGHGRAVDKDIVRRLENLRPLVESMARRDAEVDAMVRFLRGRGGDDKVVPALGQARSKLSDKVSFNEGAKANGLAAWSVLSPGTFALLSGSSQFESEEELERELTAAADAIDDKTAILRRLRAAGRFSYLSSVPVERVLSRGRLTCADDGGSRFMRVKCFDPRAGASVELASDSTNVLFLPEGAADVKVTFHVRGGGERTAARKVDRASTKQPWVKSAKGKRVAEVIEFERGDGVDAVFCLRGPLTHSFVHRAWDFGRKPSVPPREWEWWGEDTEDDWRRVLPDSEERGLSRLRFADDDPFNAGLCGSCLNQLALVEQVA